MTAFVSIFSLASQFVSWGCLHCRSEPSFLLFANCFVPPPLFSGAKSSDADGEFLVLSGTGHGHMIIFFIILNPNTRAANQVPSYVGEHHFKEYPLKSVPFCNFVILVYSTY
jgi:hypothetical protein